MTEIINGTFHIEMVFDRGKDPHHLTSIVNAAAAVCMDFYDFSVFFSCSIFNTYSEKVLWRAIIMAHTYTYDIARTVNRLSNVGYSWITYSNQLKRRKGEKEKNRFGFLTMQLKIKQVRGRLFQSMSTTYHCCTHIPNNWIVVGD